MSMKYAKKSLLRGHDVETEELQVTVFILNSPN